MEGGWGFLQEKVKSAGQANKGRYMYLAQAGISSRDGGACPLAPLMQDIEVPPPIPPPNLSQINLWLSTRCLHPVFAPSLPALFQCLLIGAVGDGGKRVP